MISALSIIIFLVVAGGLAVFVNLLLPRLWYRLRLRNRRSWASENGFHSCALSSAPRLEAIPLPLFQTRSGTVLSCLSRGPLTLIDYAFTQSIGGGEPTDSVDVRRATTAVLVALDQDAPAVTVRPQGARVPRFLLDRFARAGGAYRAAIEAAFASIETGDHAFDSVFRVLGDSEPQVRAFLRPDIRTVMLANSGFAYEIGGRHAVMYASRLAVGEELDRLIAAAGTLRIELLR